MFDLNTPNPWTTPPPPPPQAAVPGQEPAGGDDRAGRGGSGRPSASTAHSLLQGDLMERPPEAPPPPAQVSQAHGQGHEEKDGHAGRYCSFILSIFTYCVA